MKYKITFLSADNQSFECSVETNNKKEIEKLALEKLEQTIEDYVSFGYKIINIGEVK